MRMLVTKTSGLVKCMHPIFTISFEKLIEFILTFIWTRKCVNSLFQTSIPIKKCQFLSNSKFVSFKSNPFQPLLNNKTFSAIYIQLTSTYLSMEEKKWNTCLLYLTAVFDLLGVQITYAKLIWNSQEILMAIFFLVIFLGIESIWRKWKFFVEL